MSTPCGRRLRDSGVKTVLLVDDADDLRNLLVEVIGADGRFEVVADAATGDDAVALAERHRPDVCIVDVNLDRSGPSGQDTALALRRAVPGTQIVLYSGDDRYRSAADAIGVAFVEKMMNPIRFCDAIAAAVGA